METSTAISSWERSCAHAEAAARAVGKAAKRLDRAARVLEQAARVGDAAKLTKATEELNASIVESENVFRSARSAWPHSENDVSAYLSGPFGDELAQAAQQAGLSLHRLDDRWTAFPVVVEVVPKARSIKIDGKRMTALRPTAVVDQIRRRQSAPSGKPERFIEILYKSYRAIAQAHGVYLDDVYELLTILPEAKVGYSRADFARDVYVLESSPVRKTKDGKQLSFMGATGMKGSTKVLTVIPPDGMPKHYHAIKFSEQA